MIFAPHRCTKRVDALAEADCKVAVGELQSQFSFSAGAESGLDLRSEGGNGLVGLCHCCCSQSFHATWSRMIMPKMRQFAPRKSKNASITRASSCSNTSGIGMGRLQRNGTKH